MNSRGLLGLALTLLLGAVALVALPGTMGAAHAAPAVCTTTYSAPGLKPLEPRLMPNPGFSVGVIDIQVPDQRVVLDVDFGFDVSFPHESSPLNFLLTSPQSDSNNVPRAEGEGTTGPLAGSFVLDDEASTPFAAVSPPSGRYRPSRAAAELEGRAAAGRWRLMVTNVSDNAGTWGNYTLTLTVDCDADKDGYADDADNCMVTPNDQTNRDSDALGDACDLDMDGDALANTVDGCPQVAAATQTGCVSVARRARLNHVKAKHRLTITVSSTAPGCVSRASATLFRARPGRDTKLLVATTNKRGRYSLKAPRQPGKYYVKIATSYAVGEAECGRATSRSERVR